MGYRTERQELKNGDREPDRDGGRGEKRCSDRTDREEIINRDRQPDTE